MSRAPLACGWPGVDLVVGPAALSWAAATLTRVSAHAARSACGSESVTELDDVLLARVAGGDEGAYRELARRHLAAILRYASRLLADPSEAEDVTQETFLRLWQRAAEYEARGSKPSTWLYRIAHNLCIDQLRKRRHVDATALDRHSSGDRPGERVDQAELAREVQSALAQLPERQRAALVLCHYEGLSNAEAAEVLNCRVHALESLLARARRSLREGLARVYADRQEESR